MSSFETDDFVDILEHADGIIPRPWERRGCLVVFTAVCGAGAFIYLLAQLAK